MRWGSKFQFKKAMSLFKILKNETVIIQTLKMCWIILLKIKNLIHIKLALLFHIRILKSRKISLSLSLIILFRRKILQKNILIIFKMKMIWKTEILKVIWTQNIRKYQKTKFQNLQESSLKLKKIIVNN